MGILFINFYQMSEVLNKKRIQLTYNIRRHLIKHTKTNRTQKAMRRLRAFISTTTKAHQIVIDPLVNKFVWSKGVNAPPRRIRLNVTVSDIEREEDGIKERVATVEYVPVTSFKGLN